MNLIFDQIFAQYSSYEGYQIALEIIAVVFGIISALSSKRNSIWVYPTGIVSTSIFIYLLWHWGLLGDMIINAYYFVMSVYGWVLWKKEKESLSDNTGLGWSTPTEKRWGFLLFVGAILLVVGVYNYFEKWTSMTAYVDTLTTGLFFVGMWFLAKHRIENWIFLLAGNIISVPLYFYKGFYFTAIMYILYCFIAYFGYISWVKLDKANKAVKQEV